jgi:hypothetical protein
VLFVPRYKSAKAICPALQKQKLFVPRYKSKPHQVNRFGSGIKNKSKSGITAWRFSPGGRIAAPLPRSCGGGEGGVVVNYSHLIRFPFNENVIKPK